MKNEEKILKISFYLDFFSPCQLQTMFERVLYWRFTQLYGSIKRLDFCPNKRLHSIGVDERYEVLKGLYCRKNQEECSKYDFSHIKQCWCCGRVARGTGTRYIRWLQYSRIQKNSCGEWMNEWMKENERMNEM